MEFLKDGVQTVMIYVLIEERQLLSHTDDAQSSA